MPLAIRSDNGAPSPRGRWAAWLSGWWMELGTWRNASSRDMRRRTGRAADASHLAEETASPPAYDAHSQQRAFDGFRRMYNEERPRHAWAMRARAKCMSSRRGISGARAGAGVRQRPEGATGAQTGSCAGTTTMCLSAKCCMADVSACCSLIIVIIGCTSRPFPWPGSTAMSGASSRCRPETKTKRRKKNVKCKADRRRGEMWKSQPARHVPPTTTSSTYKGSRTRKQTEKCEVVPGLKCKQCPRLDGFL